MLKRARIWFGFVAVVALALVAGCGGNDDRDDRDDRRAEKALDGTFVGKLSGTNGFLAVVASPAARGQDRRDIKVYVSDGESLSEWFPGSVESNRFTATADGGDAEAKGKLSGNSASGTITLPDGETVRYEATGATAASGLYELTVSRDGELTGVSAAGVALTSRSKLEAPGTGTLKFADGKRRKVEITADGDPVRLRAAEARLIVLPGGDMAGAGQTRSSGAGGEPDFFIRSAAE
jgi:hypothetical protein